MIFEPNLIQGVLIQRYKRFLADIKLADGRIITVHCPNSGRMTGCAEPGSVVFVSPANNPKRKLKYTWELTKLTHANWIGVNTMRTNRIVEEALSQRRIPGLDEFDKLSREVKYGKNSRIDFLLSTQDSTKVFIEVKNVSLVENGIAMFPDAITVRGQKHLCELMQVRKNGQRAVMFYLVNRQDAKIFKPADKIDPDYARLLRDAKSKGVEIFVYQTEADNKSITLGKSLPFNI